jgi:DNA-binding response OmpR family regulator
MTNAGCQHILVVDDDPAMRELLRDCLEPEGFQVSEAGNSTAMHAMLAAGKIDLVTLDLMLGGENGLTIAREIRDRHGLPIIMITGKGDTIDRVVGLELGADDYIAKPFHPREVVARLRAVLRRRNSPERGQTVPAPNAERLAFEGWTLDLGRREVVSQGQGPVELTTAEFNLLEILVRRPQRVHSRDTIMDLLKGHDWTPFDRSIDALVSRLRRKIEADPDHPRLIKTVRGVGYMFTSQVRVLSEARAPSEARPI